MVFEKNQERGAHLPSLGLRLGGPAVNERPHSSATSRLGLAAVANARMEIVVRQHVAKEKVKGSGSQGQTQHSKYSRRLEQLTSSPSSRWANTIARMTTHRLPPLSTKFPSPLKPSARPLKHTHTWTRIGNHMNHSW